MQRELKDRSSRLQEEKEAAEAKYQAKRTELKEVSSRLQEKTTGAEKDIAVLEQKLQTLEEDNSKLIKNYEAELDSLRGHNTDLSKVQEETALGAASNLEQLKRELERSQSDL